ncbi:MAG: glucose 1-dehydrogenase [Nitrosopumilus sp.]
MRLSGKVAVVTGGASGIGKATSLLFAREGAKMVVADMDEIKGKETVQEITNKGGVASFVKVDVTNSSDVSRMIDHTINVHGNIDILYNNAGIAQEPTPTHELTEEVWDRVLNVNLKGVFLGCKFAIPQMLKAGKGSIINTASTAAGYGLFRLGAYCASKGAIVALTKELAYEYGRKGIRFNAICPGATDTNLIQTLTAAPSQPEDHEKWRQKLDNIFPLGRMGTPEDVAQAAAYLASDDSKWVTGVALYVDGGFTAI